jgi:hypothetical protein
MGDESLTGHPSGNESMGWSRSASDAHEIAVHEGGFHAPAAYLDFDDNTDPLEQIGLGGKVARCRRGSSPRPAHGAMRVSGVR